ncbi:MAG: hypothetical protein ABI467_00405 [Kofleriaceae bacterium]
MEPQSPVHEIVSVLWKALHDLGVDPPTNDVEHWGFSIHGAISAPGREYHNHDHVIGLTRNCEPLEVIAALYHDAVYIQVDMDVPKSMAAELATVLEPVGKGWRVLPAAGEHAATADVLAVFGHAPGDHVSPAQGLNELASALVAAIQLSGTLDREQLLAIAACIELTIPFRPDPVPALHDRLAALGLSGAVLETTVTRALRLGNRDVENFADNDAARFLDNTWKLLPESNPALHLPHVYTVRDYRIALQRMEHFLAQLPADRVFHAYGDEPSAGVHARRVARATGNLELAVRYLRAKLYSIALVEAIAEVTGGDVPLDFFMGGTKDSNERDAAKRIEQFLPHLGSVQSIDPALHRLLQEGRASESSFDTRPSPVGAFLHSTVGEPAMMSGVERARRWWAGASSAFDFLASQPAKPVAAICRGAAHIMDTRRDRLLMLAERLEQRA